ncbi:hypothetical protein KDA08_04570, partial [Candidatus Saccharibacteria bacterium]|nr:hypothetical protein [Candidatus Saccharibacteria bacterium]
AKPPTPFEQNLQTAGLAPQPTKGAIPERVQKVADTKLRSGTQEMPNQQTAKSQAVLKQPSAADRRSLKISDQANQTQRSSQPQSQSPVSKLIEGSFDDNSTTKQIKVKGKISDADYRARYGKDRAPEKVKVKPFKTEDYAFEAWKDKGALGLNRETLERNLDRVAGSDAPKVKKFLVDASRNNESNRADFLKDVRGRIRKDVVEGLGIRAKSKESDLVQKYGEGIINDKQLADMAGNKADSVKKAADYFRKEYDSLLDQWNKQRRIHGLDEVPKRSDYFRHFQEISDGISQVGVILNRSELPTSIAGITDIFKPNKPFSNAELRRMGNKTTFDAVSGMDDYLDSVSRQIFHTDTVQRGRSIENAIRKQADENNKIELPNFVANLGEWTNIVSGKKTRVDRAAEALVGRKIYGFTNWARKQTGANMVGANLSSAMSNFIPFTQSLSTTDKRAAVKGLMTSLSSALKGNKNAIDGVKSSFLNRRFMDEAIDARGIRKASEIASTPFRLVDEFTSRAIVAGKYFEGKAKGLLPVDAMKQADDYAAKTLADRSIGQTPNLFNSQTMGLFTQFQLEVNNQLSFLARDIPEFANGNKAKIASSLTQFAVFSYLFNTAYEEVTGRRPQIDPIQAVLDIKGDSDEDSTPYERLGKASKRITTGIPGAGIVTDGGRLPINSMMPDFSALGKAASNVAKGDGAVLGQVYKGVSGPLFYGLPPFGGGQLRKTVEGAYAALQGESKTPAGKKRFDIQQDPLNVAKAATFGQYATQEGKEYISKLSDSKSGIKKSGSSSISSDVDSILKAQFSTKEQRAWLATSATDKKEAAKQDPEKAK